jgi:DNA polymerase
LRAAAALLPKAGELAQTAGLDWVELAHAAAECRACRLCEGRRGQVFGAGAQRADWLLLADPSSETEDAAAAQPFSGAAGLLLGQMLRALRLDPAPALGQAPADTDPAQQAYITQPLKCRAGLNSRPTAEELQRCAPLLQRQIELLRPRVIVALGRQSAQALLATDEPLGRLRGRLHEAGGVPVVVSYSLDFLLRNAEHKAQAWQDLALAWQASRQPAAT